MGVYGSTWKSIKLYGGIEEVACKGPVAGTGAAAGNGAATGASQFFPSYTTQVGIRICTYVYGLHS